MEIQNGSCLCGSVKYTLSAEPVVTRICWCRDCQYLAANGTVNMIVLSSSLNIEGELSIFTKAAESGNLIERRFCPSCGTHLFGNSSARPQFTVVRVGTLNNPSIVKPTANIWVGSAPNWACLNSELEQIEKQPAAPKPQQS